MLWSFLIECMHGSTLPQQKEMENYLSRILPRKKPEEIKQILKELDQEDIQKLRLMLFLSAL